MRRGPVAVNAGGPGDSEFEGRGKAPGGAEREVVVELVAAELGACT